MGLVAGDFLDGHDRAAEFFIELDHLRQHAVALQVQAQVVGQYHGKRFVTDQGTATENGMPQAFHFDLAGVGKRAGFDQLPGAGEKFFLLGTANLMLQLITDIEMIFQCTLAPTGNDRHMLEAGVPCLFNAILNQGFVDDRQHFLGHGFCRRQETRAVASGREQTFTNHGYILKVIIHSHE
ncbi:hypothetical protein D3C85_667240 [compost metagenome]